MKLGNTNISKAFLGTTQIKKVMKGTDVVYVSIGILGTYTLLPSYEWTERYPTSDPITTDKEFIKLYINNGTVASPNWTLVYDGLTGYQYQYLTPSFATYDSLWDIVGSNQDGLIHQGETWLDAGSTYAIMAWDYGMKLEVYGTPPVSSIIKTYTVVGGDDVNDEIIDTPMNKLDIYFYDGGWVKIWDHLTLTFSSDVTAPNFDVSKSLRENVAAGDEWSYKGSGFIDYGGALGISALYEAFKMDKWS